MDGALISWLEREKGRCTQIMSAAEMRVELISATKRNIRWLAWLAGNLRRACLVRYSQNELLPELRVQSRVEILPEAQYVVEQLLAAGT